MLIETIHVFIKVARFKIDVQKPNHLCFFSFFKLLEIKLIKHYHFKIVSKWKYLGINQN